MTPYRFRQIRLKSHSIALFAFALVFNIATHSLSAAGLSAREEAKALAVINAVGRSGLIFIRNGTEYSAGDARRHLLNKLDWARGRVDTARLYITEVASKSLTTGKPYFIKYPDGKVVPAKEWLLAELDRIERREGSQKESKGK